MTLLTERADAVRINGRRPSDLQYEGLNTPLLHEHAKLAQTVAVWTSAGYELLGQLAAKDASVLQRILREAHMRAMQADGGKLSQDARQRIHAVVEAQVLSGMDELTALLAKYGLKPGLRIQHWDNLSVTA